MKPSLLVKSQTEKALSGKALAILLAAVLDKGVPFRFKAKGFSMSPFIKDGDIITIQPLSDKEPGVGDVAAIFYTVTEKLVVHRLIGKKGDFFIVKGDNNPEPDGLVPRENLLGNVKSIERHGKKIYLGLGKERLLIAWLTRKNFFLSMIRKGRMLKSAFE